MAKQNKASSRKTLREQTVTTQASAVDNGHSTSTDHAFYPIPPCTPPRNSVSVSISQSLEDTPMTQSSHGADRGYDTVEEQADILREELEHHTNKAGPEFGVTSFQNTASNRELNKFFSRTGLFKKRWNGIPQEPESEKALYQPFFDMISKILLHFKVTTRTVHDTHAKKIGHIEGVDSTKLKTSPDLFISGSDIGFSPENESSGLSEPSPPPPINYSGCASPIEIKTEKNFIFLNNLIQIAAYAWQCFIQQENRFFVYCAILTETFCQVFQFDRDGVMFSDRINIHESCCCFVRVILALASPDLKALGFDTSIQWCQGKRYLSMPSHADSELVRYEIRNQKASFLRRSIRGRGTLCWNVTHPVTKEKYLAKDCWRSANRTPEWELLEMAKGLDGVGQMIDYWEPLGVSISGLRGSGAQGVRDRTFCRVLLKRYGKSIRHFGDQKKLLYTFRDAIAGHQNLWNKDILHRDVSINNILMGTSKARVGNRGLLIDLDMAVLLSREGSLAGANFRTGTRAFQSIMVLRSQTNLESDLIIPAHDYLDDLESFLYVLGWICFGYEMPGKPKCPQPDFLCGWEDSNPTIASLFKWNFFTAFHLPKMSPWFGKPFKTLLTNFREFLSEEIRRKDRSMDKPRLRLQDLKADAAKHYAIVLKYFDEAIKELELEAPSDNPFFVSDTTTTPPQASASSGKRPSNDVPEGSPSCKRARRPSYAPRIPSALSTSVDAYDHDDIS